MLYVTCYTHIKSVDDARKCDELWDTNNGRTLCRDCHRKTDTYGYLIKLFPDAPMWTPERIKEAEWNHPSATE